MRKSLEERDKSGEDVNGLEEIITIRDDLVYMRNEAIKDDLGNLADTIILLSHAIKPLTVLIDSAEANNDNRK